MKAIVCTEYGPLENLKLEESINQPLGMVRSWWKYMRHL